MRPIDADALMVEVQKGTIISDDLYGIGIMAGVDSFAKKLEAAPTITIDNLRPKGQWLHHENGVAYCSECEMDAVEDGTNFCPSCGADMRGGGEDA